MFVSNQNFGYHYTQKTAHPIYYSRILAFDLHLFGHLLHFIVLFVEVPMAHNKASKNQVGIYAQTSIANTSADYGKYRKKFCKLVKILVRF